MKRQSWRDDMHRSASDGMLRPVNPEAEKIKRRKDQKRAKSYRSAIAQGDWKTVAKLFIDARGLSQQSPVDEECNECRALNAPLRTMTA